jgi:hypothetical protein
MRLPVPGTCSLQLIDDVVSERQAGINAAFFTSISAAWRGKVNEYVAHAGSPEFVATWPAIAQKRTSFLNLYLSPTVGSAHANMLGLLRSHALTLCPSCGEPGRPNTLDHYLPKNIYPHFCVTPLNLFPMCDACQREKGEKTGGALEPRFFLHPYFDVFIGNQVIDLTIQPPFEAPTFQLTPSLALTSEQTAVVTSHLRELKIGERYAHFFRDQHLRLLRLVNQMRASDQDVSATLAGFARSTERPTKNSWEHVFYSAVVATTSLIEYLTSATLPRYL